MWIHTSVIIFFEKFGNTNDGKKNHFLRNHWKTHNSNVHWHILFISQLLKLFFHSYSYFHFSKFIIFLRMCICMFHLDLVDGSIGVLAVHLNGRVFKLNRIVSSYIFNSHILLLHQSLHSSEIYLKFVGCTQWCATVITIITIIIYSSYSTIMLSF